MTLIVTRRVDGWRPDAVGVYLRGRFTGARETPVGCQALHLGIPPIVGLAQWKTNPLIADEDTGSLVRGAHATTELAIPLGVDRMVLTDKDVEGPDIIPP